MKIANADDVKLKIDELYHDVFNDIDISKLSDMAKRQLIFNYLTSNIAYDYELLDGIKSNQDHSKAPVTRDLVEEILSVLYKKKGVCNAISQVYKLLLEKVGIYSMCVVTSDGTLVSHQLNLVFDKVANAFSFDDVTSVIVGRGTNKDFFNYDLKQANKLNQGNKVIMDNRKWIAMPSSLLYYLIGRDDDIYNRLGYTEKDNNFGQEMPENIKIVDYFPNDTIKHR